MNMPRKGPLSPEWDHTPATRATSHAQNTELGAGEQRKIRPSCPRVAPAGVSSHRTDSRTHQEEPRVKPGSDGTSAL